MFHVDSERPTVKLATFTHASFNHKKRRKIKFDSFKQTQSDGKKSKKFLVAQTDTCCYVGKNFGNTFDSSKLCSHYVGILNKSTGKIKICDADLFYLNPHFKESEPQPRQETENNLSYFEKKNRLIEAFGGKSSQKRLENYTSHIIEQEDLSKVMKEALKETNIAEASNAPISTDIMSVSGLLPPCNIHATSVEEVYLLEDIISSADMARLSEHSQEMLKLTQDEVLALAREGKYCQFVVQRLQNLPEEPIQRQKRVNCLQYFQYLVTLHQMKSPNLKNRDVYYLFPEFIRKKFLTCSFVTDGKCARGRLQRTMSAYQKDKVAIYIIVLALIMDGFKTPFFQILQDLKIGRVKLVKLFGYVGAKIVREKGDREMMKNCAVLKVPLELKVLMTKKNK